MLQKSYVPLLRGASLEPTGAAEAARYDQGLALSDSLVNFGTLRASVSTILRQIWHRFLHSAKPSGNKLNAKYLQRTGKEQQKTSNNERSHRNSAWHFAISETTSAATNLKL